MCTYETFTVEIEGAGKGAAGWFDATLASVSFDHPVRAQAEHSLNIDVLAPALGPSARVALELSAQSARALAAAITQALDAAPPALLSGA
ncbi:DUF6295 family protein [Angustibacter sp. McL0619]|uniref:DUF6295 family protein n=1 Tax=Angustibacter sp. McL0619 TaxID=3415676 RepID=UPI003CF0891D